MTFFTNLVNITLKVTNIFYLRRFFYELYRTIFNCCKFSSTGIIRKVDKLGRFVLPSELREKFHIVENDALEIFTSGDMIVLKKYEARDIFTGQSENLIDYKDKKVSIDSIRELAKLAGFKIIEENGPKEEDRFKIETIF